MRLEVIKLNKLPMIPNKIYQDQILIRDNFNQNQNLKIYKIYQKQIKEKHMMQMKI